MIRIAGILTTPARERGDLERAGSFSTERIYLSMMVKLYRHRMRRCPEQEDITLAASSQPPAGVDSVPAPTRPSAGGGVQSVERAFELLELMMRSGGEAALSELSLATTLPLPTIHRLLRTLVTLGYVSQRPNRRYVLGPQLIRLGDMAQQQLGILARPQLVELVDRLGESANMAVLDTDMIAYVAQVPSPHSMRTFIEVGARKHLHDTGVGKAILAQLPDDRVRSIVVARGLPTPTAKSIGTIDELLDELVVIRTRGYAIDDEEQENGVRCYAVAVDGTPLPTAISVSGPSTRVDDAFGVRAVPLLHTAAQKISSTLRGS